MNIKYPTWKVRGYPTPNDTLWVCDMCREASWGPCVNVLTCNHNTCYGKKGGSVRLRKATPKETALAITLLKEVIGG